MERVFVLTPGEGGKRRGGGVEDFGCVTCTPPPPPPPYGSVMNNDWSLIERSQ